MKADILRQKFLDFFKSKKHKVVESDSLVPKDDPTVLFTPAGMNQFKKHFLGQSTDFTAAATAQRCLRTDDLDKVGKTSGHHTFFEMLGNFSFGGYFKKEAIAYAWEFLTEGLKIPEDKLWVSVYKDDDESYKIWQEIIKVPARRIVRLADKENFWPPQAKENGPNGPCGPCSEIFFDSGERQGCGKSDCAPGCGCARFVEVWNLVFTQFNRKPDKALVPLPKRNIDTGMGLERLAAVMQGVKSNFETDLFLSIIAEIVSASGAQLNKNKELIYAVADHIRAAVFAIYDGVLPANESRGYVVRKLIRKATLYLRALGIKQEFLYKLVPVVAEIMKAPYPDLSLRRENISEIILAEEKNFISTLNLKDGLFKEKFSGLSKENQDAQKAGVIAFQLHDTYGIPFELTKEWLDKNFIKISQSAFDKELESQKTRSKLQSAMKGDVFVLKDAGLKVKGTQFLGYKNYSAKAKILKILKDDEEIRKAAKGDEVKIILDKTPFYPESGGQAGDAGEFARAKSIFDVLDTKKIGKVILHIGKVKAGSFAKNSLIEAKVNIGRRLAIARNHTATHLLQAALRKILGGHVQQQGSLVEDTRLRFDFTHFKDINKDELNRVEETINDYIMHNYPVEKKELSLVQAKKQGALAFFAEKYEAQVRMVSIGALSKELCAGTHLDFTGQIGIFKICQEGSIASGVRRIEAVTANAAYRAIKQDENILQEISGSLNAAKDNLAAAIQDKLSMIKALEKELNAQKTESISGLVAGLIQNARQVNGMKIIAKTMDNLEMDFLRTGVDLIKQKTDNAVIVLASNLHGRALLVMGLTADLCAKGMDASKLIIDIAKLIGGSGGGRKDFAQAGGTKPENLQAALDRLIDTVKAPRPS